jgi:uncharacterized repeat protein (TIGR01451 family)
MKTIFQLCLVGVAGVLAFAQSNETSIENSLPGTTGWQLTNPALNREIEGYASLTSVPTGGSISLFVSTADPSYTIDIYRIGWYGGAGGRQVIPTITRAGGLQITPTPNTFGTFDCNWTNPYVLNVPSSWVSGIYLAKLTASSSGRQSYIIFVVREDTRSSALIFQRSVTTDEAYNNWPGPAANGKSLYTFNSAGGISAVKVSFNRPFFIDSDPKNNTQVGAGFFLRWEIMLVRWLERQGYDVAYCTNVDVHENSSLLLSHKAFLSVGHDEYWSWEMRANVEAARDHGVGVAFFSSNACYWQIRLESSPATGAADRIVVGYKSTNDPVANRCLVTTLWRSNTCKPSEQAMIGVEYIEGSVGCPSTPNCVDMVISDPSSWALAGTGLLAGSHLNGLLGYEVDGRLQSDSPPGTQTIAMSPIPINNSDAQSHPFSEMVTYVASSGATVFAVGTMQWSWGLDDWGAPAQRPSLLNPSVQTITTNVLARLTSTPVTPPGAPVSDQFNSPTLNTSLWTFVNPVGDGSYTMTGSDLQLTAPTGANHDPAFGGNNSVRVIQRISNGDFGVELKFDSIPRLQYQFEGLLVEKDAGNYLRFQFGSTGSVLVVNASSILGGAESPLISANISLSSGAQSLWMRVQRASNTWTLTWSADGANYSTVGSFTQSLTVADLGLFAGNFSVNPSLAPAFTASIDYFLNLSQQTPAPDLTIAKSHPGSFNQGQTGATYTLAVTNVGGAPTNGAVSVSDSLPGGLTATSIGGAGWSCSQPAGPCSRSDALGPAASYPAITLTVNVAANAPSSVTNISTVSGGGETNTANDSASDNTAIALSGAGPVSDDFNAATLNPTLWNFVNPVGDGSFSMTGTDLRLNVPGASNHDPVFGGADNTARVVQSISDLDFAIEVKFDSIPSLQYQFEGVLVEQDAANYLRFQFGSTGSILVVNASKILSHSETALLQSTVTAPQGTASLWMRVQRSGATWTATWSTDGVNYSTLGSFNQALTVTDLALFSGNYNPNQSFSPAFSASIDYIHNITSH